MSEIVQAALIFGVIGPLCDARLAEQINKVVAALVLAKGFQAVMHPQQMPTVHGVQLCPAIQAVEGDHGLRVQGRAKSYELGAISRQADKHLEGTQSARSYIPSILLAHNFHERTVSLQVLWPHYFLRTTHAGKRGS